MDFLLYGDYFHFFLYFILIVGLVLFALYLYGVNFSGISSIFKILSPTNNSLKIKPKTKAKGIIFGLIMGFSVFSETRKEGHCFCFGGSGSGKTSALLIPTLISWGAEPNNSSFVIDISGDIEKNCNINNKLCFNPDDRNTIPFNVFAKIDSVRDKYIQEDLLIQLGEMIKPISDFDRKNKNSLYFAQGAQSILQAALIAGYFYGKDFCSICKWLCSSSLETFLNDIHNIGEETAITLTTAYSDFSSSNDKGCFSEAQNCVNLFATNRAIAKCVHRPVGYEKSFSPADIENYNCFFIIAQERLEQYKQLLHLVVSQSLDFFKNRPLNAKKQILFCLDEFATLGSLPVLEASRTYRKRKIRLLCLTQSLTDLDLTYSMQERKALLDNFSFKIILSSSDPDSQRYFADLVGRKLNQDKTRDEHIIRPEKFGKLRKKLVLIYPEGHMLLKKNYYFKKSLFEELAEYIKK